MVVFLWSFSPFVRPPNALKKIIPTALFLPPPQQKSLFTLRSSPSGSPISSCFVLREATPVSWKSGESSPSCSLVTPPVGSPPDQVADPEQPLSTIRPVFFFALSDPPPGARGIGRSFEASDFALKCLNFNLRNPSLLFVRVC